MLNNLISNPHHYTTPKLKREKQIPKQFKIPTVTDFARDMFMTFQFSVRICLVPRPHYYASVIRFGSRGPGRSSEIRHRNQLTAKALEKAVQELGKCDATFSHDYTQGGVSHVTAWGRELVKAFDWLLTKDQRSIVVLPKVVKFLPTIYSEV